MSKRLREWRLSRARAARAEKPAAPPDPNEKFAEEAHNLDAVRKTVEDAASVSAGLWLSYLFVLLYIAIATGAVTHKDLLLENPVKLPFLGVELPLVAFFLLAPILFIVSYAYTLLHFVMLAAKVGVYDTELKSQLDKVPETRDGLRRQLPSNIFVQFLAGPRDIREGSLGWFLKAIAWISLVIGPVLLLLLIQAQFLPYHLEWVTWVQRFAVLVDVIFLWLLWPAVLNGRSKLMWRLERRGKGWRAALALTGRYIAGLTACLIPIGVAFTAATFPGEAMDDWIGKREWKWIPPNPVAVWRDQEGWIPIVTAWLEEDWSSLHDVLFNGDVDEVTRRRKSLFSNTLVLPAFDALEAAKIGDPKNLDSFKHTLVLRGRHLENAFFDGAELRKVDLEGARLQDARLDHAQLQGALLRGVDLQDAELNGAQFKGASLGTQFQGASLNFADLQGTSLIEAELQNAKLDSAQLQGATLYNAKLQGARLDGALLQGARLDGARLQGASLVGALLQGARLDGARLQGAWLLGAQLQGASLVAATLQGAVLTGAALQGAALDSAALQGASLLGAQLQGATLFGAQLEGALLESVELWRTSVRGASLAAVFADRLEEKAISKDQFATLKAYIMKEVPEGPQGKTREDALKRIEKLNPDIFGPETSQTQALQKGRAADAAAYQKALADQLNYLSCSVDNDTQYIVRGLIENFRIEDAGAQAPGLVEAILKPDCPVSAALTEADKAALKKLAKVAKAAKASHNLSTRQVRPARAKTQVYRSGRFRAAHPQYRLSGRPPLRSARRT